MSKGPGRVQRAIINTLEQSPTWRFTVSEMASRVYPGQPIGKPQRDAVHRALTKLAPTLGLSKCRVGTLGSLGWHHRWGRA